jgi:glutamate dehydrogenase
LLKAQCDLLWFGGIGTYVKSSHESHGDAGDKANDAIRVNGNDLACKVIGEGANLGLTQRGRIEAAQSGVRLNTDAIDNSAGVDSSDHEVNIKILLNGLVRAGTMDGPGRDALLAQMTDDVARHVLAHNYTQTLTISLQEAKAVADLDAHARLIDQLEASGRLDRKLEFLPDAVAIAARRAAGQGLTRPELSVLTAYCKLSLFDELIGSDAPDDAWFEAVLIHYFPDGCKPFAPAMAKHRLRREIIATVLSNQMIDLCGVLFLDRVRESTRAHAGDIAKAFAAARAIFGLEDLVGAIHALDAKPVAQGQHKALHLLGDLLVHQCAWLIRNCLNGEAGLSVGDMVARYQPAATALSAAIYDCLTPHQKQACLADADILVQLGLPLALAKHVAALPRLQSATDIADIAAAKALKVEDVARLYHGLGARIGLDDVRGAAGQLSVSQHWDKVALARLQIDLQAEHSILAASACDLARTQAQALCDLSESKWAKAVLDIWCNNHQAAIATTRNIIAELQSSPESWTFPKLSIATTQLKQLTTSAA